MTTLAFDPSSRRLAEGRVLLGGVPTRMLRFTEAGGRLVDRWRAGEPVGEGAGAVRLADRLIEAGLAHPRFPLGSISVSDVAVVIPTRDRASALAACLGRVGTCREIVIVDDGSADAASIAAVATRWEDLARGSGDVATRAAGEPRHAAPGRAGPAPHHAAPDHAAPDLAAPVRVVRRAASGGPGAARNDGLAATDAPFVAFLDSDTLPVDGWLEPLLAHFADPRVAAVAPRVRVPAGQSALAAYEVARSPLDLGPHPGVVGPGRRIGYVPAAALVVRRAAIEPRLSPALWEELGARCAFDPTLRFGEDVDLVWRLAAAGWTVRYEPIAVVEHPHRATLRAWLAQRAAYGSSAGPLARRHPGQPRHVVVPRSALLPWALVLTGRPRLALAAATLAFPWREIVAARPPQTHPDPAPETPPAASLPRADTEPASPRPRATPSLPRRDVARLALEARARTARQVADAATRVHAPLLLATRRGRRVLLVAALTATAADWISGRPTLDPVRFGAFRAADDLAYLAGVWGGCLRARTLAPLVPAVVSSRSHRGPHTGPSQAAREGKYPKLDRE